jgi:hypothetical protein
MAHVSSTGRLERRRFVRHYLEMVAAMFVGMVVFGALVRLFCVVTGHEEIFDHPGATAPIMATNMTLGMTLWMRHRRHSWPATAEMAAAMYVPMVVLLVPFWAGALPGGGLLAGMHILMLPCMYIAMRHRRPEYVHGHPDAPATAPLVHTVASA